MLIAAFCLMMWPFYTRGCCLDCHHPCYAFRCRSASSRDSAHRPVLAIFFQVIATLQRRAAQLDLRASPQPFKVRRTVAKQSVSAGQVAGRQVAAQAHGDCFSGCVQHCQRCTNSFQ